MTNGDVSTGMSPPARARFSGLLLACLTAVAILGSVCCVGPAQAVPSFARQTGLACEACHTVFPELTPFGRRFKLGGYTLTTRSATQDIDLNKQSTLTLQDLPPLSIMAMVSTTWWNKPLADSGAPGGFTSQNGQTEFPQQISLFYGGKIAPNMGALFQMTYQQSSGSFGIDNSDIRFANSSSDGDFVYGLSLNNNPSVQDVWNTTPAWGFPYFTPAGGSAPAPYATPLIYTLGGNVGGIGAYLFYKDSFYIEASVYRSALQGVGHPYDSSNAAVIDNVAPYWRAAFEHQWNKHILEVGTIGLWSKYDAPVAATTTSSAQGIHPGNPDTYTDTGLDAQYQFVGEENTASLLTSYMHETIDHNRNNVLGTNAAGVVTASKDTTTIDRWQATATYYFRRKFGGSIGFTKLTGTQDSVLFPACTSAPTGGAQNCSSKGKPDSQFETIEFDYLPWLNTKILAQYIIYNQVNGGSSDYAGTHGLAGGTRKASDDNTAMIGLWTAF